MTLELLAFERFVFQQRLDHGIETLVVVPEDVGGMVEGRVEEAQDLAFDAAGGG